MEIYKKCLFGKEKKVMFGLDTREVYGTLRALPEMKYFYYNDYQEKVFYKSPETVLEEWVD